MAKWGRVMEIKPNEPHRVKTDTCPRKFRQVLKIFPRRSTPMISNDTLITITTLAFAVLLIVFYCIVVGEYNKPFFKIR